MAEPEVGNADPSIRMKGTVLRFNESKGVGFIAPDDGSEEVFVHSSVIEDAGYQTLFVGQRVGFQISSKAHGERSAVHVRTSLVSFGSGNSVVDMESQDDSIFGEEVITQI